MADRTDYSFKKLVGREYSSNSKAWYEEKPGYLAFLHRTAVWTDDIPAVPPASSTLVIKVYDPLILTRDTSVDYYKSWKAEDPPGTRLHGFIPPRFGQGYTARIYDNNNREIPATDGSSWLFDYDNGLLTFDNDPSSVYGWNAATIKLHAYLYIGSVQGTSIWKTPVPTVDDLPVTENTIGDVRPVVDGGDGMWALYQCISITGPVNNQWQILEGRITHLDCGVF